MTAKKEVQRRTMLADLSQWLLGEYPLPVHLVTAPTLEEWSVVWTNAPDGRRMCLQGIIAGASSKNDGHLVRTTPVVLLDRHFEWCRTANSVYRLGQPAGIEIPIDGVGW